MSAENAHPKGLLAPLEHKLEPLAHHLGWPFNTEGKSWLAGEHISLTHVLHAAVVFLLLLVFGLVVRSRTRNTERAVVPESRFSLFVGLELFVEATYKMMSDIMGAKAARYFLPLIGTCAFFILGSNLLGLVPGFAPPTDKLNTTLACSVVILIVTQVYGLKENGWDYVKHFAGPVRKWYAFALMLMIAAIELFSHFLVRPGTLSVRLMANMTADHLVLETFHTMNPIVAFGVPIIIYMLGVLVCVVQALVFCLLSTTYIAMAIEHEEH